MKKENNGKVNRKIIELFQRPTDSTLDRNWFAGKTALVQHKDNTLRALEAARRAVKRQRIEALLKKPGFDILLFSGGGNDIAGDQFCLWLKPNTGGGAASAVDTARLQEILGIVEDGYRDLIDIRDRCAPDCWIVAHAYDFPQPSDQGVCGLGPWLKPSLDYRSWNKAADQFVIAKMVLSKFNDLLVALETEQKTAGKHFLHVRTQGTLNPRKDWANETHPNAAGFTKIARVFSTALNGISSVFPKVP